MSFNSVGTLIVIAVAFAVAHGFPMDRSIFQDSQPAASDSFSVVPVASPTINDVKNSSEDITLTGAGFRQVFLSAFLPGGLSDAISRKEPRQRENLVETVQGIKEDVAEIRRILREQQDEENYKQYVAKVEREAKEKDTLDFFDIIEFVLFVAIFCIVLKMAIRVCEIAREKARAAAIASATADPNEEPCLAAGLQSEKMPNRGPI